MKLFWILEKPIGTSRRGGETSRRGEVLWLVGLHVEVKHCDLDEQLSLHRRGVHPVIEDDDGVQCALLRLG